MWINEFGGSGYSLVLGIGKLWQIKKFQLRIKWWWINEI